LFEQQRYPREAWVPIAAGLVWLWCAASFGVVGFLFSLLPGCLLLASGVSTLLYPGDLRIPQFAALGGLLGVPLALPAFFVAGFATAALLVALSAASFVAAGLVSVRQAPHHDEVPPPVPTLRLGAEVAADEALLATMALSLPMTRPDELGRVRRDVHAARELYRDRGWLEKPASYHALPPLLERPEIRRARTGAIDFEHLRFESGYEPRAEEPGRDAWRAHAVNRTAHAWVVRRGEGAGPWLVCLHGYQMGLPAIDLRAFEVEKLHRARGLNLALPVLPLHGPRKAGRRSGDGFLAGDPLSTVHAFAQAMWDVRRLLTWVRAQGATRISVFGLSLGGYATALLASLDDGLAGAIAGVPLADVSRAVWRHGPPLQIRYFEERGVVHEEVSEVLRVVSPLALEPKLPRERRFLFGAVADRLVPPDQVRDLWRHWERPRIVWYQGGHVTFRLHRDVRALLDEAIGETLLRGESAL
jgi:pimeloyl-ACP methyl ester carboxylesterase